MMASNHQGTSAGHQSRFQGPLIFSVSAASNHESHELHEWNSRFVLFVVPFRSAAEEPHPHMLRHRRQPGIADPGKLIDDHRNEEGGSRYTRFTESGCRQVRDDKTSEILGEECFCEIASETWSSPAEYGGALAARTGSDGWLP
jgi:hypothetical protein